MGRQGVSCFHLGLLFGSVLLVASAPAALQPHSCSDKEQQVTVSHTYKIDVPKSALVQVEADPQPLGDDGTSLLALGEAEEQNIIFRHNIRLQTPQKDCELAGIVQDLLDRVQKLEGQMAEVKEQCDVQRCCQGAAGELTTWYSFSEHLTCTFQVPGVVPASRALSVWWVPTPHSGLSLGTSVLAPAPGASGRSREGP